MVVAVVEVVPLVRLALLVHRAPVVGPVPRDHQAHQVLQVHRVHQAAREGKVPFLLL